MNVPTASQRAVTVVAFAILMLTALTISVPQSPALDAFVGKDLRRLSFDKVEPLRKLLGKETPATIEELINYSAPLLGDPWNRSFPGVPWYVWATKNSKPKRFIVFEGGSDGIIPGNCFAWIHVFDEFGRKLNEWSFSTGYRMNMIRASFSYRDDLAVHLITIETAPQLQAPGGPVWRQYYAFSDNRLRFAGMVDAEGVPVHTSGSSKGYGHDLPPFLYQR